MKDKVIEKFKEESQEIINNLYAPLHHKIIAYADVDDDYDGFFCEIIDDLETFYDVSKYPAVAVSIALLRDYSELACHYPSKKTLQFLKSWRKQK